MMKKVLFILAFKLSLSTVVAQDNSGYLVLLNNDTIKITEAYWLNNSHSKIECEVNKVVKVYKAKDVLAYKINSEEGEAVHYHPMAIGFKRWLFLERSIKGKVCMFEKEGGATLQHNSGQITNTAVKVYWYRKVSEPRGQLHKLITRGQLSKFLSDCPAFVTKLNSKESFKNSKIEWVDEVLYYNKNCK
jgi:hypothetical protein